MSMLKFTDEQVLQAVLGRIKEEDGCWIWQGASERNGYGVVRRGGRLVSVHRFMFEMVNGPIAPGLVIRHACSRKSCCNPAHLSVGTQSDNVKDSYTNGERLPGRPQNFGRANGVAKLDEEKVARMRRLRREGWTISALEDEFGVEAGTIRPALDGRTWANVPDPITDLKSLDRRRILTEGQIAEAEVLRREGLPYAKIAARYGVSDGAIRRYLSNGINPVYKGPEIREKLIADWRETKASFRTLGARWGVSHLTAAKWIRGAK